MFERFTEKSIKVIMLAQEESRRLGHNFIGTEQLLLGLIGEGTGIASRILKSMGVNLKDTRIEVEKLMGRGSGFVTLEIPFTPRAKKVLEFTLEESRQQGHNYISTEHLLLGLIRERESECVAVKVLSVLNVDLAELRNRIIQQIHERTSEPIEGVVITSNEPIEGVVIASKRVKQNFKPIEVDDAGMKVGVVITSKRVEQNLDRLTTILTEAKVLIQAIEKLIQGRTSASSEDIDNVINQLPISNQDNQPGIKELLIELKAVIDADLSLTSDDKNEALEQVLVLAAAGQQPTKERMQKFAKTALKILKATVAELDSKNNLVEACNRILPTIAHFFV